jgi:hypothetical protein
MATTPEGQTFHGDHAYVFYQIPVKARKLPLVFWHGIGQFSKTWETTPDGREGYQNIFLRRGLVYTLLTSSGVETQDGAQWTQRSILFRTNKAGSGHFA